MFPLIRSRWDAHTLSRKLRKSLATPDVKWKIDTDDDGQPTLSNGDMRIVLVPRAVRVFDAIHIYSDDAEIWLPLVARLRLRAAARLRLIQDANEHMDEATLKETRPENARWQAASKACRVIHWWWRDPYASFVRRAAAASQSPLDFGS